MHIVESLGLERVTWKKMPPNRGDFEMYGQHSPSKRGRLLRSLDADANQNVNAAFSVALQTAKSCATCRAVSHPSGCLLMGTGGAKTDVVTLIPTEMMFFREWYFGDGANAIIRTAATIFALSFSHPARYPGLGRTPPIETLQIQSPFSLNSFHRKRWLMLI